MDKILKNLALFLLISFTTYAQNVMLIPDVAGNAKDTIEVNIEINNSDLFVAFQTDIELPDVAAYLNNSAELTGRADGHSITANIISEKTLRIIVFSMSQNTFSGNSGSVLKFNLILNTLPGNYTLPLQDPIISDLNSVNILTGSDDGVLTLVTPDIASDVSSINFGEIPLTQSSDKNVTLYNYGNSNLAVSRIFIDNPYFVIIGDTTFTIPANSSRNVTIRFNSTIKGTFNPNLIIQSDDPDEPEYFIELEAIAFAVNELHILSASGRSGYPVQISFTINNMEEFVGFQFDMILPSVLTYLPGSVLLSDRQSDHVVSANIFSTNKLRVVAYSPTNSNFSGSDGQILTIEFMLDGTGGNHSVALDSVLISDVNGSNIISDYYSSFVNIASPDISGQTNINFTEVSVLDTVAFSYEFSNSGNDTLIITSFSSPQPYFWNETPMPARINPGQQKSFLLKFHNSTKGNYSDRFIVRSNDPDEDPFYIDVSASAYAPNYIIVKDTFAVAGDTITLPIEIENHEEFVAFQVDLHLTESLMYISNSAALSERAQDHVINVSVINGNSQILRIFAFSLSQSTFYGNSGAAAHLDFLVKNSLGSFPLNLQNGIISDAQSVNIIRDVIDGNIQVMDPSPVLSALPNVEMNEDNPTTFPISDWFDYVIDPNDPDELLAWAFYGNINVRIGLTQGNVTFTPDENWFGQETVQVIVSDGVYSDTTDLPVIVNSINDTPVLSGMPDITFDEDGSTNMWLNQYVFDVENDSAEISFSAEVISATVNDNTVKITTEKSEAGKTVLRAGNENLIITINHSNNNAGFTASADSSGIFEVVFTAMDDSSATDNDTITVTVNPINDSPELSGLPDIVFNEDDSTSLWLNAFVLDADDDTSEISFSAEVISATINKHAVKISQKKNKKGETIISVGNDDLLIIINPANNKVDFIASPDSSGLFEVVFTAMDDSSTTDSDTMMVTVNPVNDEPELILSIEDIFVLEDFGEYVLSENLYDHFSDIDNEELEFILNSTNNSTTVEIILDTLKIHSVANQFINDTLIVTASDGKYSVSDTSLILISPINDVPVVLDLPPIIFDEDSSYSFDLDNFINDPDNLLEEITWSFDFPGRLTGAESKENIIENDIRFNIKNDSINVTIDDISHIVIISAAPNFTCTNVLITFTAVDDSSASGSDTTTITITPVNDPPQIGELPVVKFNEDDSAKYNISYWLDFVEDPDDPDSLLTFHLEENEHLFALLTSSDSLIFYAEENWFGNDTLSLFVSDGIDTANAELIFNVYSINDPPTIENLPDTLRFETSFVLTTWDYINDIETINSLLTLVFQSRNDSVVVVYNEENGKAVVSVNNNFIGETILIITVSDDSLASTTDSLLVIVDQIMGVNELPGDIPVEYFLYQNYPNPFNPTTTIQYRIPITSHVSLTIYNMNGQVVERLVSYKQEPGFYSINWDARNVSTGVYFYRIHADGFSAVKKCILIK